MDDLQPFDPDAFADALFDVQREEAPVIKEDRAAWEEERREEERLLEEQARAEAEAAAVEEEQPEPWEEEPAPVEEAPQEEPQHTYIYSLLAPLAASGMRNEKGEVS